MKHLFLLLESREMSEQELRARLNQILVALCDPSLDDKTRQLMLTVAKELQELIQASWPREKASWMPNERESCPTVTNRR
jgi:hypothetical protein